MKTVQGAKHTAEEELVQKTCSVERHDQLLKEACGQYPKGRMKFPVG